MGLVAVVLVRGIIKREDCCRVPSEYCVTSWSSGEKYVWEFSMRSCHKRIGRCFPSACCWHGVMVMTGVDDVVE